MPTVRAPASFSLLPSILTFSTVQMFQSRREYTSVTCGQGGAEVIQAAAALEDLVAKRFAERGPDDDGGDDLYTRVKLRTRASARAAAISFKSGLQRAAKTLRSALPARPPSPVSKASKRKTVPLPDPSSDAPSPSKRAKGLPAASTLPKLRSPAPPTRTQPSKYSQPIPPEVHGKERNLLRKRARRLAQREEEDGERVRPPKQRAQKHRDTAQVEQTDYSPPPSLWQGRPSKLDTRSWSVDDFSELIEGVMFRRVRWAGGYVFAQTTGALVLMLPFSLPKVVLDREGRLLLVLAGHPNDPTWGPMVQDAARSARAARERCVFDEDHLHHRRGDYPTLGYGISYGGGRTEPGPIDNKSGNEEELEKLFQSEPFQRMAGFADGDSPNPFTTSPTHTSYRMFSELLSRHIHRLRIHAAGCGGR